MIERFVFEVENDGDDNGLITRYLATSYCNRNSVVCDLRMTDTIATGCVEVFDIV